MTVPLTKKLLQIKQNKHAEAEKKTANSTNNFVQISEKGYDFLLGRMYFTGNDCYQNFIFFSQMLRCLILDSNKSNKVVSWKSTGISPEKIKPFHVNLEPAISNLVDGRLILKFNNFVLAQKKFFIV